VIRRKLIVESVKPRRFVLRGHTRTFTELFRLRTRLRRDRLLRGRLQFRFQRNVVCDQFAQIQFATGVIDVDSDEVALVIVI
jgi:hypothetical protein